MCMPMNGYFSRSFQMMLIFLLTLLGGAASVTLGKVGEPSVQQVPEVSIKCGDCPCVDPCSQQQQQPPPPPSPPPPKTAQYCPPLTPPPPRFVYVTGPPEQTPPPRFSYFTGPPGDVYPIDPFNLQRYSSATRSRNICVGLLLLVGSFGLLEFFFWGL